MGGGWGKEQRTTFLLLSKAFHYVNGVRARAPTGCPLVSGLSQFTMLIEAEASIYVKWLLQEAQNILEDMEGQKGVVDYYIRTGAEGDSCSNQP